MGISPANSHGSGYPLGLTGATAATRYVGGTASGAPVSGSFLVGDFVIAQDASIWICTVAGSPGTWTQVSGGGGVANPQRQLKVYDDATIVQTGDGQIITMIPSQWNGLNLIAVAAYVTTVSSSGTPTVQVRNVTDAVDMLSTRITIDANETTSYTAATPPVIDGAHDDVATGDLIAIDVDVAGTGAKGLGVELVFG